MRIVSRQSMLPVAACLGAGLVWLMGCQGGPCPPPDPVACLPEEPVGQDGLLAMSADGTGQVHLNEMRWPAETGDGPAADAKPDPGQALLTGITPDAGEDPIVAGDGPAGGVIMDAIQAGLEPPPAAESGAPAVRSGRGWMAAEQREYSLRLLPLAEDLGAGWRPVDAVALVRSEGGQWAPADGQALAEGSSPAVRSFFQQSRGARIATAAAYAVPDANGGIGDERLSVALFLDRFPAMPFPPDAYVADMDATYLRLGDDGIGRAERLLGRGQPAPKATAAPGRPPVVQPRTVSTVAPKGAAGLADEGYLGLLADPEGVLHLLFEAEPDPSAPPEGREPGPAAEMSGERGRTAERLDSAVDADEAPDGSIAMDGLAQTETLPAPGMDESFPELLIPAPIPVDRETGGDALRPPSPPDGPDGDSAETGPAGAGIAPAGMEDPTLGDDDWLGAGIDGWLDDFDSLLYDATESPENGLEEEDEAIARARPAGAGQAYAAWRPGGARGQRPAQRRPSRDPRAPDGEGTPLERLSPLSFAAFDPVLESIGDETPPGRRRAWLIAEGLVARVDASGAVAADRFERAIEGIRLRLAAALAFDRRMRDESLAQFRHNAAAPRLPDPQLDYVWNPNAQIYWNAVAVVGGVWVLEEY